MNIVLYSTHCPRCTGVEKKLEAKGIQFEVETSVDDMLALGITQVPMLRVDDKLLNFAEANTWVNNQRS